MRHLGEDAAEIDLPVAERTEPARALDPGRIAGIDALPPGRIEFGVLDVERLDALVIDVDEGEIVELLQHEVRGVVQDVAALVAVQRLQEPFERRAVENVLAGVNFIGDVDAGVVERIEDRLPALGEFRERGLDQARGALRPGIDERPGQRSGERGMRAQAEMTRGVRGHHQLLDRPGLTLGRAPVRLFRREDVERIVVDWIDRDELALQMRREFGDFEPVRRRRSLQLVAIGLRRRRLGQIDEPAVPGRNLHALVAERRRPSADRVERIERRRIARELREEYRRSLDLARHASAPL